MAQGRYSEARSSQQNYVVWLRKAWQRNLYRVAKFQNIAVEKCYRDRQRALQNFKLEIELKLRVSNEVQKFNIQHFCCLRFKSVHIKNIPITVTKQTTYITQSLLPKMTWWNQFFSFLYLKKFYLSIAKSEEGTKRKAKQDRCSWSLIEKFRILERKRKASCSIDCKWLD